MQHSAYLLGIEIWVRFLSFLLFFSLAPKPKYISQYELMLGFKNKTKTKLDLWYLWFYFKQLTISMPMTQILIYFFFFFCFFNGLTRQRLWNLHRDSWVSRSNFTKFGFIIMSTSSPFCSAPHTDSLLNFYHLSAVWRNSKGKKPAMG